MTRYEGPDDEVRYEGSYDVGPEASEEGPDDPPNTCSLCDLAAPQWWYQAGDGPDQSLNRHGLAFARWWAVCSVCHKMLVADDAKALSARVEFDDDFTLELLPAFMRLAHMTGDIESL